MHENLGRKNLGHRGPTSRVSRHKNPRQPHTNMRTKSRPVGPGLVPGLAWANDDATASRPGVGPQRRRGPTSRIARKWQSRECVTSDRQIVITCCEARDKPLPGVGNQHPDGFPHHTHDLPASSPQFLFRVFRAFRGRKKKKNQEACFRMNISRSDITHCEETLLSTKSTKYTKSFGG